MFQFGGDWVILMKRLTAAPLKIAFMFQFGGDWVILMKLQWL